MSEQGQGSQHGEGFLDKVKDFFTGDDGHREDEAHRADDAERADEARRADDVAEHEPVSEDRYQNEDDATDTDATDPDAWDGSGEPPEVEIRESEAVNRHLEETGGAEDYEGRHGAGSEDSDGAAEHDHDESGGPVTPDNPDSDVETAVDHAKEHPEEWDGDGHHERDQSDRGDDGASANDSGDSDSDSDSDDDAGDNDGAGDNDSGEDDDVEDEQARREREEAFATEHDPADHDVEAGEEFRQRGDWAAGEDGPQVQEPDGTIHEPGSDEATAAKADSDEVSEGPVDGPGTDEASSWTAHAVDDDGSDDAFGSDDGGSSEHGLRESSLEDIRDGGHGWGSAAPIAAGVRPLGHPVKAWYDTGSFVLEDEDGYEGSEPDVWFVDEEAARRAGFRHGLGE